jgi:hypothetical protein
MSLSQKRHTVHSIEGVVPILQCTTAPGLGIRLASGPSCGSPHPQAPLRQVGADVSLSSAL